MLIVFGANCLCCGCPALVQGGMVGGAALVVQRRGGWRLALLRANAGGNYVTDSLLTYQAAYLWAASTKLGSLAKMEMEMETKRVTVKLVIGGLLKEWTTRNQSSGRIKKCS